MSQQVKPIKEYILSLMYKILFSMIHNNILSNEFMKMIPDFSTKWKQYFTPLYFTNSLPYLNVLQYRDGKEELSLLEAAKRKDMQAVVGYIDHQVLFYILHIQSMANLPKSIH